MGSLPRPLLKEGRLITSARRSLPFREGVGVGYAIEYRAGGVGVGLHQDFGAGEGCADVKGFTIYDLLAIEGSIAA